MDRMDITDIMEHKELFIYLKMLFRLGGHPIAHILAHMWLT